LLRENKNMVARCHWGMNQTQLKEWLEADYLPLLAFAVVEKPELCTVLFPITFIQDNSSWWLAESIGKVVSQELQLCRTQFKKFYKV
jgi:hypothetical protein